MGCGASSNSAVAAVPKDELPPSEMGDRLKIYYRALEPMVNLDEGGALTIEPGSFKMWVGDKYRHFYSKASLGCGCVTFDHIEDRRPMDKGPRVKMERWVKDTRKNYHCRHSLDDLNTTRSTHYGSVCYSDEEVPEVFLTEKILRHHNNFLIKQQDERKSTSTVCSDSSVPLDFLQLRKTLSSSSAGSGLTAVRTVKASSTRHTTPTTSSSTASAKSSRSLKSVPSISYKLQVHHRRRANSKIDLYRTHGMDTLNTPLSEDESTLSLPTMVP